MQIRKSVFETNSSSSHSITICLREEFEKWKSGELIFSRYDDKLIPTSEMTADAEEGEYQTYSEYEEDYEHGEEYTAEYTSPSGVEIIAFGKYSYDN